MRIIFLFIGVIFFENLSFPQSFENFVDTRDGKSYRSIKIGRQVWMAENLSTQYFRNGDIIPHAKTKEEWLQASTNKTPAWCYYENDSTNNQYFGKLYNWYAVDDKRGLAPEGWIIPISTDISQLVEYLCNLKAIDKVNGCASPEPCKCAYADIGDMMKLSINKDWGRKANNKSGWSSTPGGMRGVWLYSEGLVANFKLKGQLGEWWLADSKELSDSYKKMYPNHPGFSNSFYMEAKNNFVQQIETEKGFGFSVRCIRAD